MKKKLLLGLLGLLAAGAALAQGIALLTTLASTDIIPLASGTVSAGITAPNLANYVKTTATTGGTVAVSGGLVSPRGWASCGQGAISTTTPGTDTTPVNTETYIAELFVPANFTATGVALFNGSAVAGNVKISLANASTGAPITAAQTASTAQSGTAAYQLVPFATPYAALGPQTYLVLVQFDTNTTPRFRSHAIGTCGASKKTGETYGTFTTVTPPTTFTTGQGPIVTLY